MKESPAMPHGHLPAPPAFKGPVLLGVLIAATLQIEHLRRNGVLHPPATGQPSA